MRAKWINRLHRLKYQSVGGEVARAGGRGDGMLTGGWEGGKFLFSAKCSLEYDKTNKKMIKALPKDQQEKTTL